MSMGILSSPGIPLTVVLPLNGKEVMIIPILYDLRSKSREISF